MALQYFFMPVKIKTRLLLLFLLFLLLACNQKKKAADGQVIAVKDGDTIEILENGQPLRIRLAEVDAPEKNQDFGTQAKKYTSDLSFGKQVRLIRHETDRYGRVVATVFLPDGRSLNEELVKNGFAWHYTDYSKSTKLANLQADARRYKRGLWAHPNPLSPWEFRKMQREGKFKKKPAAPKKQAVTGKPTDRVWVCSSKTVKFYHIDPACGRIKSCSKSIDKLTLRQATAIGKGKRCSVCG